MRCRVSPFFDRGAEVLGTVIDSGRGEGMVVLALFEEILRNCGAVLDELRHSSSQQKDGVAPDDRGYVMATNKTNAAPFKWEALGYSTNLAG